MITIVVTTITDTVFIQDPLCEFLRLPPSKRCQSFVTFPLSSQSRSYALSCLTKARMLEITSRIHPPSDRYRQDILSLYQIDCG